MSELNVFELPVFADANIWSMWPADKLNELADDIRENGFDHRYPITIANVEGVMMLLDGRNRREAARIAGVIPPVIVTDIDPKLAVHRSNNQNRDATPGQKAMATAMAFPEAKRGGDRKTDVFKSLQNDLNQSERNAISRARYVLRNNSTPEGQNYPQRCLDIMAGSLSLTEAYDLTQTDVKRREEEEAIRKANAEKLVDVRNRYPDLAALVDDERITLQDAIASAESRDRETAEKKRLEEEAKRTAMAEEERKIKEEQEKERYLYEADRATFTAWLKDMYHSAIIADTASAKIETFRGEWDWFEGKTGIKYGDLKQRLNNLQAAIPDLLQLIESMHHV